MDTKTYLKKKIKYWTLFILFFPIMILHIFTTAFIHFVGVKQLLEDDGEEKKYPSTPSAYEAYYLIWSIEHNAWWKEDWDGYTKEKENAGQYNFDEAYGIVKKGNIRSGDVPNEAMILYEQNY